MAKPCVQPTAVATGHSQTVEKASDSQTLAAFGAARIDHSAAATGFHANQKAVGTGAACLGGLVGAFHISSFVPNAEDRLWAKPKIIANFRTPSKFAQAFILRLTPMLLALDVVYDAHSRFLWHVDKLLISPIS
jgi:hypothetical protein